MSYKTLPIFRAVVVFPVSKRGQRGLSDLGNEELPGGP